jgi:hypothetical protein
MSNDTLERKQAIGLVLGVLRSPLSLMSVPTREQAEALSREYNITALELLQFAIQRARNM